MRATLEKGSTIYGGPLRARAPRWRRRLQRIGASGAALTACSPRTGPIRADSPVPGRGSTCLQIKPESIEVLPQWEGFSDTAQLDPALSSCEARS
jgi:hypothetical protein